MIFTSELSIWNKKHSSCDAIKKAFYFYSNHVTFLALSKFEKKNKETHTMLRSILTRNAGGGLGWGQGGQLTPSFWQISEPFLNQGKTYYPHPVCTTSPPRFSDLATALG